MRIKRWLGLGVLLTGAVAAAAACGRGHHFGHGELSEEQMREKIERGAGRVLSHVDATDQQVSQVNQVLSALVPDLVSLRQERKALTQELQIALRKQEVNPAELEALRLKGLALADKASARGVQALADVAAKLEPAQRAKLISEWTRRTGS
jgi:hypothetical protein